MQYFLVKVSDVLLVSWIVCQDTKEYLWHGPRAHSTRGAVRLAVTCVSV